MTDASSKLGMINDICAFLDIDDDEDQLGYYLDHLDIWMDVITNTDIRDKWLIKRTPLDWGCVISDAMN